VWWYSRKQTEGSNSNVSQADVVPTLIAFMGTLAPILLSFFIFVRAWVSGRSTEQQLLELQRRLNVHTASVRTEMARFALLLNDLEEVDRMSQEPLEKAALQRRAMDNWQKTNMDHHVQQQVLSIHELLSSEEYNLSLRFRLKRFFVRTCCKFQPSYVLNEIHVSPADLLAYASLSGSPFMPSNRARRMPGMPPAGSAAAAASDHPQFPPADPPIQMQPPPWWSKGGHAVAAAPHVQPQIGQSTWDPLRTYETMAKRKAEREHQIRATLRKGDFRAHMAEHVKAIRAQNEKINKRVNRASMAASATRAAAVTAAAAAAAAAATTVAPVPARASVPVPAASAAAAPEVSAVPAASGQSRSLLRAAGVFGTTAAASPSEHQPTLPLHPPASESHARVRIEDGDDDDDDGDVPRASDRHGLEEPLLERKYP